MKFIKKSLFRSDEQVENKAIMSKCFSIFFMLCFVIQTFYYYGWYEQIPINKLPETTLNVLISLIGSLSMLILSSHCYMVLEMRKNK